MPWSALLSMVFPDPGEPTISTLCCPAAAMLIALFAMRWPLISQKSIKL